MGSIRKRANGSWLADSKANGTRQRKTFKTYADAEGWLSKQEAGLAKPAHSMSLRDLLQRWHRTRCAGIATSKRGAVKPATLRNDREVLKAVQRTGLANEPVAQLDMDAIRRHCEWRAQMGAQVVSYNRDLRVIKGALNWAVRTGLIEKFPLIELTGLSSVREDEEPQTLTRKEQGRLLAACDPQLRTIVVLCLFAGLRRGEALSLQGRDVDLKRAVIHVRGKRLEDGTRWSPKSKQRRLVPIGKRLRWYLERYITRERGHMMPSDWFFIRANDGGQLRSVEDRVRRAYRRAGMEPQGLHVCRRTYATCLAESGANAEIIRRLGGWSSLEVVQRSYFNVGLDALRSAVENVG